MRVGQMMNTSVRIANPQLPISEAAGAMAQLDIGALPVGENDRLVGMITDRDIAVRAVATGKGPETPVREIMSTDVCYCYDDQDLEEISDNMADIKVRRLPVVNRDKRLVGIISLGDIALSNGHDQASAAALCGISEPGGDHSQSSDNGGGARLTRTLG